MAVLRAQAILKSTTGMIRDNCVNTFHFNGTPSEATLNAIAVQLDAFYRYSATTGFSISEFLSTSVQKLQIKIYDVTTEPSGPPLKTSAEFDLAATRRGSANLPEEVAVALSFAGTPAAGLDQARRRGRVFVGPLRNDCVEYIVGAGVRVRTEFRNALLEAGKALATGVDPVAEWVVYSRPFAGRGEIVRPGKSTLPALAPRPGSTVNIDQVSVDDAVDTQRRRGPRATLRTFAMTGE